MKEDAENGNVSFEMDELYFCHSTGMQFMEVKSEDESFFISKNVVTQETWQLIMGYNPSQDKGCNKPVTNVNYAEIKEFCEKTDLFLPTINNWLLAAGKPPESLTEYGWYWTRQELEPKLKEVGKKKPNKHGLYDMYGNVWELTITPSPPNKDILAGFGGGFHFYPSDPVIPCMIDMDYKSNTVGFRCCKKFKRLY